TVPLGLRPHLPPEMRALLWVRNIFPDAAAGALPTVNEVSNSSYVCDRNVTLGLVSSGHCATDARRDSHANSGSIAPEHSGRWAPQFLRGPQCPVFAQPHSQPAPEIFSGAASSVALIASV